MRDGDCVRFLQWCLPRLGLRWSGYRRVRGTVCKRLNRRLRALGLADWDAYRRYLEDTPQELEVVARACRIPVSRFYRDRAVFDQLRDVELPRLAHAAAARGASRVAAWSCGCASGEEPYSLALLWRLDVAAPTMNLDVLATDAEPQMIARARVGCYAAGSLRDVPAHWRPRGFEHGATGACVRRELRRGVALACVDVRTAMPEGPFDLILCRNLAFTYFVPTEQRRLLAGFVARLMPAGVLVIGAHETLPTPHPLAAAAGALPIYRKGA